MQTVFKEEGDSDIIVEFESAYVDPFQDGYRVMRMTTFATQPVDKGKNLPYKRTLATQILAAMYCIASSRKTPRTGELTLMEPKKLPF